ncbi:MAG: glycosyltransferase family 4 protein [Thermosynechococcaceae cyanobacterium MS004]|nr:glycosyltransferase family 4 protein [Thermosynechococcaceae cyanobacterium MS004]
MVNTPHRLALFYDYPEEDWPSMDLCAQMLHKHLKHEHNNELETIKICPPFVSRLQQLPGLSQQKVAFNGDRLLNRFWDYPHHAKSIAHQFKFFHICDHSYAQMIHVLPPERTGIYCHDIDAFRSLLNPPQEIRPAWYRAMSRRILAGIQKAAVVFYSTAEVRRQIEQFSLILPERLVQAPLGISTEFSPNAHAPAAPLPNAQISQTPFLLHVGSCIPRKRIDVLLEVFATLRQAYPNLSLVKVSGDWSVAQQTQIAQLDLHKSIHHFHGLERSQIAALYRQASVVLQPSEAEGFGLPIIEALACGSTVVASDIPVLREVGGNAAIYCPVGDIKTWIETLSRLIDLPQQAPSLQTKLKQASKYSWSTHASIIAQAYLKLRNS